MSKRSLSQNMSTNQLRNSSRIGKFVNFIEWYLESLKKKQEPEVKKDKYKPKSI